MSAPRSPPALEPPRKRLKFTDETVTVVVGSERVSFTVHKGIICQVSPFFEKALRGDSKEEGTKEVMIPNIDPANFEIFLQCLYTDFACPCHILDRKQAESPCRSWSLITELYGLAQHFHCPAFSNSLINCIRARLNDKQPVTMPAGEDITAVYSQTSGDCALRRLVVLMNITMMRGGIVLNTEAKARAWIAKFPTEFVKDLAIKFLKDDCAWYPGFWNQLRVRSWLRDKINEYAPPDLDQHQGRQHTERGAKIVALID